MYALAYMMPEIGRKELSTYIGLNTLSLIVNFRITICFLFIRVRVWLGFSNSAWYKAKVDLSCDS